MKGSKDFQLTFASILKYIAITLIIIGVVGFVVSLFVALIFAKPVHSSFGAIITSAIFCYALSILVHAAALYIKNNTPEPPKSVESLESAEPKETPTERDEE